MQVDSSNQYLKIGIQRFTQADASLQHTKDMILSMHFRRSRRFLHFNGEFSLKYGNPVLPVVFFVVHLAPLANYSLPLNCIAKK
jgi:hypothetical protein